MDGNPEAAQKYLDSLKRLNINHIDTARVYLESETVLGQLQAGQNFIIDTKVPGFTPKSQTRDAVFEAQKLSFEKLHVEQVDVYYLHGPDPETPIEETLAAINDLYKAGKFKRFGLSNFDSTQVEHIYAYCTKEGYVPPTVYQGGYNAVSRQVEKDLFPVLRKFGIVFYAYAPIAGGFLSKSVEQLTAGASGRWDPNSKEWGVYHAIYNRPEMMKGLTEWNPIAQEAGIDRSELAYRFIAYHSLIDAEKGDALIVGASRVGQLEKTMQFLEKGPLSSHVVDRIEKVWEIMKDVPEVTLASLFK
ncbi:hypothetical protein HDV00_001053 [Rhizophlyctis rosea]|nr:hypothetical protein HDV00_001053 [Rhizophlyctis rosea]